LFEHELRGLIFTGLGGTDNAIHDIRDVHCYARSAVLLAQQTKQKLSFV